MAIVIGTFLYAGGKANLALIPRLLESLTPTYERSQPTAEAVSIPLNA